MSTNTISDALRRFLETEAGNRTIAAYVGVRSTDPAAMAQATENAAFFAPALNLRSWSLADLRRAALRVDRAGVYRAIEELP